MLNNNTGWGDYTFNSRSAFRAYQSAAQTIPSAQLTKVSFQTEDYDNLAEFDNSVNFRFTAKQAGIYLVDCGLMWATAVAGNITELFIYKNGITVRYLYQDTQAASTAIIMTSGSATLKLGIGDYVEIFTYTSNSLALSALSHTTYFEVTRIA